MRNFKSINGLTLSLATIVLVLPLLGWNCMEKPGGAPEGITDDVAVQQPAERLIGTGDCAHEYYPLMPGYSVSYRQTTGDQQVEYAMTVAEASDAAAKMEFKFTREDGEQQEMTFTQELSCSGGNLVPGGFLDMSSAFGDFRMRMDTDNVEGYLMPANFGPGEQWVTSYDITMTPEGGNFPMGQFGKMKSSMVMTSDVLDHETVTVPAGTYDALKVKVVTTTTTEIPNMPGNVPPTETQTESYQWWARGVGLVKMESGDGSTVTEATEVRVP